MQQAEMVIDTVKDMKTNVLKTVVTDESFRKPLQAMIDAEAQLAKAYVKTVTDFAGKIKTA